MARQLDFYFDCSSPWTYLAFHAIQPLAAELGAEIAWKPILVGGVFNAVNQTVYDSRAKPNPRKQAYMLKDLADWARLYGLGIVFPPTVFPVNSVKCMRGAFVALDEGKLVPYATAAFEASLSRTTFQFSSKTSPPCDQRIGRKSATTGFVALPRMM